MVAKQHKGSRTVELLVAGIPQTFIPIKIFRQSYQLSESFGVHYFEPKDYIGLAAMENAGPEMNTLRRVILAAIPEKLTVHDLLPLFDDLQRLFDETLASINGQVGLKPEEMAFAVAGFGDVNQALTYALIRARRAQTPLPSFQTIYETWLNHSVRISSTVHDYQHRGQTWHVQVVNHVYGRVGLRVDTGAEIYYVHDSHLACPAEGFMATLLAEIAARVMERL